MTQLEQVRKNKATKEMRLVAKDEKIELNDLKKWIKTGTVVMPANINHRRLRPIGIGKGLRTKINTNIGTSPLRCDLKTELKKLKVALEAGTDTVMDLSTAGDLNKIRREIIKNCPLPVGTVPIYQAVVEVGSPKNLTLEKYLKVFEKQAKDGVDFMTVHAGVTLAALPLIKKRLIPVVSRGGSFLIQWMKYQQKENFLYEYFEEILKIAKKYDVTLSLGDGLRPGCLKDATDKAQILELKILGKLAKRSYEFGAQVMIEGPGHIPLNQIKKNVELEKKYCQEAPFYVLGPLPIDNAAGYDHIAGAIGGALAAYHGVDFLCYLTPKEHLGLPDVEDVREGVMITKIAAQIADIAKGIAGARLLSDKMSQARKNLNWDKMLKYSLDPIKFKKIQHKECKIRPSKVKFCSMCGPYCTFINKI